MFSTEPEGSDALRTARGVSNIQYKVRGGAKFSAEKKSKGMSGVRSGAVVTSAAEQRKRVMPISRLGSCRGTGNAQIGMGAD